MTDPATDPHAREFARRLNLIHANMAADGLDFLVSADSGDWLPPTGDARYLTGFTFLNLQPAFIGLVIVVPAHGDPVLVMPAGPQGGFADWARRTARTAHIQESPSLIDGVTTAIRSQSVTGARVGIAQRFDDFGALTNLLEGYETVDAAAADATGSGRSAFERARSVKSDYEIERLAAAQTAADIGMSAFWSAAKPGARNTFAQASAREAAAGAGADEALVIMNAGNDPWMWWHYQGERLFPEDGVTSVEVNARVDGYTAQLARTRPTPATDDRTARLLDAGEASIEAMVTALRPGATGHDVWSVGHSPLKDAGFESWGRLGHGMGLAMDEGVSVVEGNEVPLEVGSVVAVHAAPWDPDTRQSGLIGEQYVIRADGAELLSQTVPPRSWRYPETD